MGWLRRFRLNRAAKRYAAELPARLRRGWGTAEFYTPEQIRAAAREARLDTRFIALGYAAFLPEPEFHSLWLHLPRVFTYEEARTAFRRHLPAQLPSAGANQAGDTNLIIAAGGTDSAHPPN
jgi:hypothetical protein